MIIFIVTTLLSSIGALILFFYYKVTKNYGSFRSKGIVEEPATFPFGSQCFWDLYLCKSHMTECFDGYKKKYPNEKFIVVWDRSRPILLVLDLELSKNLLVKDFETFPVRREFGIPGGDANKYLRNMVSIIRDVEKWKSIRSMLSPAFTSGKLKSMLPYFYETAGEFLKYVEEIDTSMINGRDLMNRYNLQSISTAGFGVKGDCFEKEEKNSKFLNNMKNMSAQTFFNKIFATFAILLLPPKWIQYLNIPFINEGPQSFFIDMINSSIKKRREETYQRGDFVDLILAEFKKNSENNEKTFESKFEEDAKISQSQIKFDREELELVLISNIFLLLFTGFETTTSVLTNLMMFLANNSECQNKLFNDLSDAISENNHDENLDFNTLQEIKYLDHCIHETIRLFPLALIERESVKKSQIFDTNLFVDPGTLLILPTDAFNKSPDHFKSPNEFRPERFQDNETPAYAYNGFGHGPRNCIGMRFALIQLKAIISKLVYNYEIKRNEKTVRELKPKKTFDFNIRVEGETWISLEKRK